MDKVKLMKVIKKLIIILVIIIAISCIYLATVCLVFPLKIKPDYVDCVTWDATYPSLLYQAEQYESGEYGESGEYVHSFNGIVSEDENDYMDIYCDIKVENRSFFGEYALDAAVCDAENFSENLLFSSAASIPIQMYVKARSEETITVLMTIYIGDMSDEDIHEFVDGLKIKVVANGMLGNVEKTISMSECDDVVIENILSNK